MEQTKNNDLSLAEYYQPSQTALLLLDFHSLFVEKAGGPNAGTALKVANELREWAKSQGIVVIHGLVDINQNPTSTCKSADRLSAVVRAMLVSGGEESVTLSTMINGTVEDKTFLRTPGIGSALSSPGMLDFLQQNGIRSLVLCGLSTSGCVLRTALSATDEGFVVTIISDGCADPDQSTHQMLMDKILSNRAYVRTANEFRNDFAAAHSG